MTIIANG